MIHLVAMKQKFDSIWMSLSAEEKRQLAKKAGTSVPYLSQVAHKHSGPSRKLMRKLIRADDRITAEMFL